MLLRVSALQQLRRGCLLLTRKRRPRMGVARRKRLPMDPKRVGGKSFYKGRGARREGALTSKGRFLMQKEKITQLVVPDLKGCTLKPYVARTTPPGVRGRDWEPLV